MTTRARPQRVANARPASPAVVSPPSPAIDDHRVDAEDGVRLPRLALLRAAFDQLAAARDVEQLAERAVLVPAALVGAAACRLDLVDALTGEKHLASSNPPRLSRHLWRHASRRTFVLGHPEPTPLGTLHVFWLPGCRPPPTAVALLRLLVGHFVVLFERLCQRERERASLYALDIGATSQAGLDSTLAEMSRRIMRACRAECGGILVWDYELNRLVVEVCVERAPQSSATGAEQCGSCRLCWPSGGGLVTRAMDERRPVLLGDVQAARPHAQTDIQSVIAVPMLLDGRPVGVISLGHSRPHTFTSVHLRLLSTLAGDAARVIRNHQNRVAAEELALTTERGRIAHEIHDGVTQDLALLAMRAGVAGDDPAEAVAALAEIRELLIRDIGELRRAVYALRPIDLEKMGLEAALRKLVAEFGEHQRLKAKLGLITPLGDLDPRREGVVFRTVQEGLANAARHGQAKAVDVRVSRGANDALVVEVQDDGVGFAPDGLPKPSAQGGMGLVHMRERLAALGGTLTIRSAVGQGTTLTASLPPRSEALP